MASTNISERASERESEREGRDAAPSGDYTRQARIAKLLMELAAIRPARRRGDVTRRRTIEAELVLLLDAEVLSRRTARQATTAASTTLDGYSAD
jgi:hypothetical protein